MGEPARPQANRLQRPSWRDSRLVIGVMLVLGSVVLGSVVVAQADDRVPVWAAAEHLMPGQPLDEGDLVRVDVRIDAADAAYLPVGDDLPSGQVVRREIRPGELMPRSALADADDVAMRIVTLPVDPASARMLVEGSVVTVWASTRSGGATSRMNRPKVALDKAVVHSVPEAKGALSGSSEASVRLLVDRRRVRDVADLVANEAVFFLALEQDSLTRQDG